MRAVEDHGVGSRLHRSQVTLFVASVAIFLCLEGGLPIKDLTVGGMSRWRRRARSAGSAIRKNLQAS